MLRNTRIVQQRPMVSINCLILLIYRGIPVSLSSRIG